MGKFTAYQFHQMKVIYVVITFLFFNMSFVSSVSDATDYLPGDTSHLPDSFGFGRLASQADIDKLDIDIRPDGKGLPNDTGLVRKGKRIYNEKCALCHGNGDEPLGEKLASVKLVNKESVGLPYTKVRTIGNYWPYATTLFDYIRRTMPLHVPGSLKDKEVYHLTAYILYANNIIDSSFVLTQTSLPRIVMPARDLFVPDDRKGGPEIK